MKSKYLSEYIKYSNAFNKNQCKQTIHDLYDLLYKLQRAKRSIADDLVLVNVYSLLGFHQSAYLLFKKHANISNRKDKLQLYKLADKASWHKDDFALKDIRKLKTTLETVDLCVTDFIYQEPRFDNKEFILKKPVIIFNKSLDGENCKLYIDKTSDEQKFLQQAITELSHLNDFKEELINYYNQNMQEFSEIFDCELVADEDWYYTLEVYRVCISVYQNRMDITISCGDNLLQDNYLEIEVVDNKIAKMSY